MKTNSCDGGRSASVRQRLLAGERVLVRELIDRVIVENSGVTIVCSTPAVADVLAMSLSTTSPADITFRAEISLSRTGKRLRLDQGDGSALTSMTNPSLIGLLVKARRWWAELRRGDVDVAALAQTEGVQPSYVTRVLRLAFLSPAVVDAILAGRQSAATTVTELTLGSGVDENWAWQERVLPAGAIK